MADSPLADTVAIRSYREAKEVLNDADRFAQASKRESWPFVGDTVLTLDGDPHFERRRLLSRLMRHRVLTRFEEDVIDPTVHELVESSIERSSSLDLVRFSRRVFLRLAVAMIGLDLTEERVDGVIVEHLYPLIEAVTVEWSTRPHHEVLSDGVDAMRAYVEELVAPAITDRRDQLERDPAGSPSDLIGLMLREGFEDREIHREAVLFLVASTLNNAATLTHAFEETDRWVRAGGQVSGATSDLVGRLVNETLRLRVVTPAVFRRCEVDTVLGSGRHVAQGARLAVLLPDANIDPEVWGADADAFDPLRQTPPGEKPYGLAFGAGVHACLGRPLVLGSYSKDLTAGMLNRIFEVLLRRGAAIDRRAGFEVAASDQTRYETFPLHFDDDGVLMAALGTS